MSWFTKITGDTSGQAAEVDVTTKGLHTLAQGVTTVDYNPDDFTLDAFNRLRTSNPIIAFEASFNALTPTLATTIWETGTVGAGSTEALTTNLYGVNLTLPVTTSVGRFIQSINHVRYAPGISTIFRFTFNFNNIGANIRHRIGMFTDQGTFPSTAGDGFYLENAAGALAFVRRYMTQGAGSEERVLRADWNLDKCDGTGTSGFNLNKAAVQHFVAEYQWLGVGSIRFGFQTENGVVWAHKMVSVNSLAEAWSRTGSLPVRAEVYNTGVAAISSLTLINCVVLQEGDVASLRGWKYFAATSGATGKVGGTAVGLYPLLSLRPASTNDLTKRARCVPTSITVSVVVAGTVGVTPINVQLLMLPTPNTGATFAVTPGGSVITVDNAATSTTAVTGSAIWAATIPNVAGSYTFDLSQMRDNANVPGYNAAGTVAITGQSVLTLAAGPAVAAFTSAATLTATINWKEIV